MAITVHLSEILKERGMTALLLLDLCGGVLAHPEQPGTEQDRFADFHCRSGISPCPEDILFWLSAYRVYSFGGLPEKSAITACAPLR